MRLRIPTLLALLLVSPGCGKAPPVVSSVSPKTICANVGATIVVTGTGLDAAKVEIGRSSLDLGAGATPVAAASVSGNETTVSAVFGPGALTASDVPYDVIVTNHDGQQATLPAAI